MPIEKDFSFAITKLNKMAKINQNVRLFTSSLLHRRNNDDNAVTRTNKGVYKVSTNHDTNNREIVLYESGFNLFKRMAFNFFRCSTTDFWKIVLNTLLTTRQNHKTNIEADNFRDQKPT